MTGSQPRSLATATYINSEHHWKDPRGQIEVMCSGDEGRTWDPPNTYLDGSPVSGLPSAPSPKDFPLDPVEPYMYLAPNGDLVITAMDGIFPPGRGEPRPGHDGMWIIVSADGGRTWGQWTEQLAVLRETLEPQLPARRRAIGSRDR